MNREYEIGLVINPDLGDEQLEAQIMRIGQTIETRGGEVIKLDRWGRRRLAYPIGRHRDGYYAFLEFRLESQSVKEVEQVLHVQEDVLRHLITYRDPRAQAERRQRELRAAAQQAATAAVQAQAAIHAQAAAQAQAALAAAAQAQAQAATEEQAVVEMTPAIEATEVPEAIEAAVVPEASSSAAETIATPEKTESIEA
jgi:small subunit ribosomal protein S6